MFHLKGGFLQNASLPSPLVLDQNDLHLCLCEPTEKERETVILGVVRGGQRIRQREKKAWGEGQEGRHLNHPCLKLQSPTTVDFLSFPISLGLFLSLWSSTPLTVASLSLFFHSGVCTVKLLNRVNRSSFDVSVNCNDHTSFSKMFWTTRVTTRTSMHVSVAFVNDGQSLSLTHSPAPFLLFSALLARSIRRKYLRKFWTRVWRHFLL